MHFVCAALRMYAKNPRLGPSASQVQPDVSALQQKIAELERQLRLQTPVSAPPEPAPPAEKEKKKKKIPDAAKTAEQIRAEKAAPAVPETSKEVDENEEGEEEEDLDGDELEEGEDEAKNAETPLPPTTALAVPPKTAAQDKINSSTHKCEYNRLMRHMASSATQFPNMAQLWNGNNKDPYFFLES